MTDDEFYEDDEPLEDIIEAFRANYFVDDTTASSNDTYVLDIPCAFELRGCLIVEMLHYGQPTGILWCQEHGRTAGIVRRAA